MRVGPAQNFLSNAAGWIAAGLGLVAVLIITALTSSPANALGAGILFVGLLAAGFLAVAVHELGHAVAAWAVGWRVWIISVLGIVVRPGYAPRLSTKYSHDVGGYVLGSPPDDVHDTRWRSIVFSAGGPLASLLTGAPFIAWLATLPRDGWETPTGAGLLGAMLAFGVVSAWSAVMTLWPMRLAGGRPNDMMMILSELVERRLPDDARGASWAWALFEHGVEPSAWPHWMRESVTHAALSPWAPQAAALAFACALEDGDADRARGIAKRSTQSVGPVLRAVTAACLDDDAVAAEAALADAGAEGDPDTLAWLRAFAQARILKLKGNAVEAQRAYDQLAEEIASGVPQPFWERLLAYART